MPITVGDTDLENLTSIGSSGLRWAGKFRDRGRHGVSIEDGQRNRATSLTRRATAFRKSSAD
jgi:hypothetical protein